MRTTAYRYPNEQAILAFTLFLVAAVIALTATATVCTSLIFIILFVVMSYNFSASNHQALIRSAQRVTPQTMPRLDPLIRQGVDRLQPGLVEVFIAPSKALNAYTFGLSSPKVVVLYSSLFQVMDGDELLFIFGHELGHVALGHTWLNSLAGGMAGIPSSWGASLLLTGAFLWWNRTCEFSADRAGLLACGRLDKAVTALIKLAVPEASSRHDLEEAYRQLDAQDDSVWGNLSEALGTHPMLIKRIQALRQYAGSSQYQRLQAQVSRQA